MVPEDLLRAGHDALATADWERARECFEKAVAHDDASAEALAGLGWARLWLGEYDGAAELMERALAGFRERAQAGDAAEQARRLAFVHGAVHGRFAVAQGWFARAERLLADAGESADHGWLALERAPLTDDAAERERLAATALAIARRHGDRELEYVALSLLGEASVQSGRIAPGMALLDEALAAVSGGEVTGVVAIGEIYCRLLSACERATDVRRAEQWLAEAERFAGDTDSLLVSTTCRLHYGGILVAVGRWAEAEAQLLSAARLSERSFRAMRMFPVVRLADLRVRQGRLEEARRLVEGSEWHPVARRALAAAALATGELALAGELARLCVDDVPDPFCAPALGLLVEIELARGDLETAASALERLEATAARTAGEHAAAWALLAAGRVGAARGDPGAPALLRDALEAFSALDLPLEAARSALALSDALAEDAAEAARTHARLALETFDRLGATRDADAAAARLRTLGGPGRSAVPRRAPLTAREGQVLALLTDGLSNAEIARRLVISPRTAEHHVASILRKLGLRGRAEAAAYGVRAGREDP